MNTETTNPIIDNQTMATPPASSAGSSFQEGLAGLAPVNPPATVESSETSDSFCSIEPNTGSDPSDPSTATDQPSKATRKKSKTHPRRRRLRRSSRPTGTPRARTSRVTRVSTSKPRQKKHVPTPFAALPEFASLSPEDIECVHDFIRHHTYQESIAFLRQELGIEISLNRLYRYRSRLDLAEQLHINQDNAPAIENLLGLLAGKPVDLDSAGLSVIKQRALQLAARPDTAPSILMNLFRIFTWEHRKTVGEHRMQSIDRREECRERMTTLAERRQDFAEKEARRKQGDDDLTLRQKEDALLEIFGDFPPVRPWHETPPGAIIGQDLPGDSSGEEYDQHSDPIVPVDQSVPPQPSLPGIPSAT